MAQFAAMMNQSGTNSVFVVGYPLHWNFHSLPLTEVDSPLGALGANAIAAATRAKRVTIWKVFMMSNIYLVIGCVVCS